MFSYQGCPRGRSLSVNQVRYTYLRWTWIVGQLHVPRYVTRMTSTSTVPGLTIVATYLGRYGISPGACDAHTHVSHKRLANGVVLQLHMPPLPTLKAHPLHIGTQNHPVFNIGQVAQLFQAAAPYRDSCLGYGYHEGALFNSWTWHLLPLFLSSF